MRNSKTVEATFGRDAGKKFLLTELPAEEGEEWFLRANGLIMRAGSDVPADLFRHGPAGFVVLGMAAALAGLAKSPWPEVKPLLDKMWTCVAVMSVDGSTPMPAMTNQMIEEVRTRVWLREEVLSLHLGFSVAARVSDLRGMVATLMTAGSTQNTSTSASGSEPS